MTIQVIVLGIALHAYGPLKGVVANRIRDWCPHQQAWDQSSSNNTQFGISGMKIKCGAVVYPPFSTFDEETNSWSGYDFELFAEVAQRGNFEYEIIKLDSPPEGETWDQVLFGQGREVDILCTWWGETAARKRRGMDFTIPTVETSLMLTTPTPKRVEVAFKEQFWTFLQPFSRNLWLVLLFGGVFTAIFMYFADPKTTEPLTAVSGVKDRSGRYDQGVLSILRHSLFSISNLFYQGWVLATIQDPYKPSNPWSKLYLMSWTGVLIVLLAAYTAQLTTFLIVELQSLSSINKSKLMPNFYALVCSLDDLYRSGNAACALTSVPAVNSFLKISAPSLPIVPIGSLNEALPAVRDGTCSAALLGRSEVELLLAENERCDMRTVGGPLNFLGGAYAADTANCGQFVLRVVDAILQAVREEGVMDEMWDTYTELPARCVGKGSNEEEEDNRALSLSSVGGLFIIHAAFTFVALCGLGIQTLRGRKHASTSPGPQDFGATEGLEGCGTGLVEESSVSGGGYAFPKGGRTQKVPPI